MHNYYSWLNSANSSPNMKKKVFQSIIDLIVLYASGWGVYLPDLVNNNFLKTISKNNFAFKKLFSGKHFFCKNYIWHKFVWANII